MKSYLKRIVCLGLSMLLLFGMIPVQAAAASTVKKSKLVITAGFEGFLPETTGYSGKITNLKSSNKKVVKVSVYKDASTGKYFVQYSALKTGTSTVSYKSKGKTYKVTVKVTEYENPVSSIKLGSVKIAGSSFSEQETQQIHKYSKLKNGKVKLQVKLKDGWSIENNQITYCYGYFGDYNYLKNAKN